MDKLIIGAGLYGLYAALYCAKRGQQVEVLEIEQAPFTRATEIDDSRLTVIRALSTASTFISVLSGKINTVYDLAPFLD